MNESNDTAALEYVDVTIGTQKLRSTKAMADRFIEQMSKQPQYQQQFYNPLEFESVGLDNV